MNDDGTTKSKLRPVALLETVLKLVESVVVDQRADHSVTQLQARQVGYRVTDGAEPTIGAVRQILKVPDNMVLMAQSTGVRCIQEREVGVGGLQAFGRVEVEASGKFVWVENGTEKERGGSV